MSIIVVVVVIIIIIIIIIIISYSYVELANHWAKTTARKPNARKSEESLWEGQMRGDEGKSLSVSFREKLLQPRKSESKVRNSCVFDCFLCLEDI